MKPANTKKFVKDLKKEIHKLDIQINLAKTGMDIAESLGDKADYKSNKLEYDKLIVQKNIKNDLLQSTINKLPMDKMAIKSYFFERDLFLSFVLIPPISNFDSTRIITVSILLYTSPPKLMKIDTKN